jgi:hypothetical protein
MSIPQLRLDAILKPNTNLQRAEARFETVTFSGILLLTNSKHRNSRHGLADSVEAEYTSLSMTWMHYTVVL